MEVARRVMNFFKSKSFLSVSILVFMEVARRGESRLSSVGPELVSILVFMEVARRAGRSGRAS